MTLYNKPRSEVFASNAPESEISTFTAWLRGLGIAFDETNGLPEMSGLNNVFNLLNQYIKYLEQNGFAEWSSDLEYPVGAGVRVGVVWYRAKTQNTNKNPQTSQNDWELFLNASALQYENPIYIENNVVKIRSATQTQTGVVQFANATEVANKANINKAINPANVVQMFESWNSGIRLPNGLIFEWGTIDYSQNPGEISVTIEFEKPFPNQVINVSATRKSITSNAVDGNVMFVSATKSSATFQLNTWANSGTQGLRGFTWFAIGF